MLEFNPADDWEGFEDEDNEVCCSRCGKPTTVTYAKHVISGVLGDGVTTCCTSDWSEE